MAPLFKGYLYLTVAFLLLNVCFASGLDSLRYWSSGQLGVQTPQFSMEHNEPESHIKFEKSLSGVYDGQNGSCHCDITHTTCSIIGVSEIVGILLGIVPKTVNNLTIRIDVRTDIYYYKEENIDLRNISDLTSLKTFAINYASRASALAIRQFTISYAATTFQQLSHIQQFQLNIAIHEQSFTDIMKYFPYLSLLDLSNTQTMGYKMLRKTIKVLNKTSIRHLYLKNYQTIGSKAFSQVFNMNNVFGSQEPLEYLETLDISRNDLGVIRPSLITLLPHLKQLDFSYNSIILDTNAPFITEVLFHPSINRWIFSNQGYPREVTRENKNTLESSIDGRFSEARVKSFRLFGKYFEYITYCTNRYSNGNISIIFNNHAAFCKIIGCMSNFSKPFDFSGIPCSAIPKLSDIYDCTCSLHLKIPFFQNMTFIEGENINWLLPQLQTSQVEKLCFYNVPLKVISVGNNRFAAGNFNPQNLFPAGSSVTGLYNIEVLDYRNNDLNLTLGPIHPRIPTLYSYKMKVFQVAQNTVQFTNRSISSYWPHIKLLNLSSNQIKSLFQDVFSSLKELEVLDLSYNFLNLTETFLNLSESLNWKSINLSHNRLDILPTYFTNHLDTVYKYQMGRSDNDSLEVRLDGNPFQCSCSEDALSFVRWFQTTNVKIYNKETLACSSINGLDLIINVKPHDLEQKCNRSYIIIIKSVIIAISVIASSALLVGIYYSRWKLKYHIFKVYQRLKCCKSTAADEIKSSWKYDAFISYCAEDRFWVHDVLMKTLEDKYGFNLCIHYRDFPLGVPIVDAIIKAIQDSREIIIVLSDISVRRPWCYFELQVAMGEAVRRKNHLIIIKLGRFTQPINDSTVNWVVSNHVYLEWSGNKDAQKLFWAKLVQHLYGEINTCCTCYRRIGYEELQALTSESESEIVSY